MTLTGAIGNSAWYAVLPAVVGGFGLAVDRAADLKCGEGLIKNWTALDTNGGLADIAEKITETVPGLREFLENQGCDTLNYAEVALFGLAALPLAGLGVKTLFSVVSGAVKKGAPSVDEDQKQQKKVDGGDTDDSSSDTDIDD